MKRNLILGIVALLVLSMFAACAKNPEAADPGNPQVNEEETVPNVKDDITLITVLNTESFDPYSGANQDKTVLRLMFDTLFNYDENGNIIPCLAESWEDDGMTLTIKLREDVMFTDGSPLTADDVVYAFECYTAEPAISWVVDYAGTCEKVDEYTVVIHKPTPYAPTMSVLTEYGYIVPSGLHSASPEDFSENPVGSGPYKFVSQEADGSVIFTANEEYFLGAPYIKNVTVNPPVEPSTAVIALETGEVDLIANMPMAQKQVIQNNEDLVYVEKKGWVMNTLLLCGEKFSDVNLRKAIYYAMDLESIVMIGNEGVGEPAKELCSDIIMGDYAGQVPFGEYDIQKAEEYLAASGYTEGTEFTLSITPDFASVAQVIQSNLAQIDIDVTIEQLDLNALYAKMFDGTIEMTVTYIGNSMTTIESIIDAYNANPFDMLLHKNDELGTAIDAMKNEFDEEARGILIVDALQKIKDNADMIPLFEQTATFAHSAELSGVQDIAAASYIYYVNQMKFE